MLSHKVLTRKDVGRAASYYEDGADDYYAGEGEASLWQGKGAAWLGLSGPVDGERLRELLAGRVVPGAPPLRGSTREDARSRIGIDLTFSAPKSVSLQALVGGDLAVIRAHDLAVERAVAAAEERAQARTKVKGKSSVEDTRNLVVARFRHETSREGDPQLHTHALVLNLTRRRDGAWRALRNDELVKSTRYLGAVYRAELAAELQRAGYRLRHAREGFFELAHVSRAQLLAFSRRAGSVERRLAEAGLTRETATSDERQRVALATRPEKRAVDRAALFAEWQARAREVGIDFTLGRASRERGEGADGAVATGAAAEAAALAAARSVRFAVAHLTERQAIVTERELLDVALKHAVGRARLEDVRREVERQAASGALVGEAPLYRAAGEAGSAPPRSRAAWVEVLRGLGVGPGDARAQVEQGIAEGRLVVAERRYTTRLALERETRILRLERDGRGQLAPVLSPEAVGRLLAKGGLTPGQSAAVELIATARDRVVGVQGLAGTGKSHMLAAARRLVEAEGYQVVALAPYAAHVRALRELGVEARTVASFLAAKEKGLHPRTVLVLDEAGTVPTRQMEEALRLAGEAGARVVLLGDTRQTKAIEAGRPFEQLQGAGMRTALMQDVQRQRDPALREAVVLAALGEPARSLKHLPDVREIRDDHARRAAIAADYARLSPEERAGTLIVSGTNEARREINRAVREDLGLAGEGREYATLVRRDTTQAERAFARHYSPGEFIQPEQDYPRAGLVRGRLYEVQENGPGNVLTVRGAGGELHVFSPTTCRQLSVYEEERAELAPGDRVRVTRNDAARDLANGDRFTVAAVGPTKVTLSDGKRQVELPAAGPLHLDHAYATTVHSSQGTTAERVLIDAVTRSKTTARDVYYVAVSRARLEARIYTDDAARLPRAIGREHEKHAALDLVRD